MNNPLVTVLMPVYNAGMFVKEAMESILTQSYMNLEFLIINDGSTDDSLDIIRSFDDSRIRLMSNPGNLGLIRTLNIGIEAAKGKYIARMDADDVSLPGRLKKQIIFLENNPGISILAGMMEKENAFTRQKELTSEEIKARLIFSNILPHPTIVFRASLLKDQHVRYDPSYPHAEDYALWMHLSESVEFAILPEKLIEYRNHETQVSRLNWYEQVDSVLKIQSHFFLRMGIHQLKEEMIAIHKKIYFRMYDYNPEFLNDVENWLLYLQNQNSGSRIVDPVIFENTISKVWFEICTHFASKKLNIYRRFRTSTLFKPRNYPRWYYLKFLLKIFLLRFRKENPV
jgi:glycosyltransferase involved in cell wall biosynthesis